MKYDGVIRMETIERDCNQVQLKHYRNIKHPLKATEQCVLNSETQSTITLRHTTHIKENGVAPSRKVSTTKLVKH